MQRKIESRDDEKKQERDYHNGLVTRRRECEADAEDETERKHRNKRQRRYYHDISTTETDHSSKSLVSSSSSTSVRSMMVMSSPSYVLTRGETSISDTNLSNVPNYSPRAMGFRNSYYLPSDVIPPSDAYFRAPNSSPYHPYHTSRASANMLHLPTNQSLIVPSLGYGLPHSYYGHTTAVENRECPPIPSFIGLDTGRRFSTQIQDRFPHNFVAGYTLGNHNTDRELIKAKSTAAEEKKHNERNLHYRTTRPYMPLSYPEDKQYLAPWQCYLRKVFIEVFKADKSQVLRRRSNKVQLHQIGFRCRFCAHLDHKSKAKRSATFPSSLSKIYQTLNVMVIEHLSLCKEIPTDEMEKFNRLKDLFPLGSRSSSVYWANAAKAMGIVDTKDGLFMNKELKLICPSTLPPMKDYAPSCLGDKYE